jgi:hypothetical protein
MEEPMATYQEARFELRRKFELFPDRVRVTGKGLHLGRFDVTVALSILRPQPNRVWIRGWLFRYGLWGLLFAACVAGPVVAVGGPEALARPWVVGVLGAVASVALILVVANVRPVEFAQFQTDAGVFALDVARVGPQTEDFDGFIDLLIERIEEARAMA